MPFDIAGLCIPEGVKIFLNPHEMIQENHPMVAHGKRFGGNR